MREEEESIPSIPLSAYLNEKFVKGSDKGSYDTSVLAEGDKFEREFATSWELILSEVDSSNCGSPTKHPVHQSNYCEFVTLYRDRRY